MGGFVLIRSYDPLATMGGFVLIRSYDPLDLMRLKFPDDKDLFFVPASPEFEAPTQKMRAVLPAEIGMMVRHVWNTSHAGALVASLLQGDLAGMGKTLSSDKIVEPKRAPLIPGMEAVKKEALEAGAFGCTISGAGPMAVAVVDGEEKGKVIGERRGRGRRERERKRGRRVEEWKTIRERRRKSRRRKRKSGRR